MPHIVKMNYSEVEQLVQTLSMSAENLNGLIQSVQMISVQLELDILVGQSGNAFASSLQETLLPSIIHLRNKLEEKAQDVRQAMDLMMDSDQSTNSSLFGS